MRTRIITIITLLLSTPMIIAQKSMDEIDRESFAAKLSPIEVKGIQMTEAGNIPLVRDTPADRKSTRLNSSHREKSRMPSSA